MSKPYDGPISLNNKKRQTHCKESFFLFVVNRTGKRSTFGLLKDGINSVIRYYKNNFADGFRQVCDNVLLIIIIIIIIMFDISLAQISI